MKKLIIFDCDGVLVDSEIIASRVDSEILTNIGYLISPEECIEKFTGMNQKTIREIIKSESGIILPENFSEISGLAIINAIEKELQSLMISILQHPLVSVLRKCVASSSPRERVLKSLNVTQQNNYFKDEHIFTSAQVKNGKPAPDLFLFAAEQMGYHPNDCLVIEDSVAGIQAARAASMEVIAFLGGSHAKFDWYKERIKNLDVLITHDPNELLHAISCSTGGGGGN